MKFFSLVPYYFTWHYTLAIKNLFHICLNFIWFIWNFFSFKILLKTLFTPYKRLTEHYNGGLDIERFLETIVVNLLMRIVGFIARSVVLILGLISLVIVSISSVFVLFIWLLLPFILLFFFVSGLIAIVLNKKVI
jgi:hypothetical protein